ncbi:MAG: hypothetical protein RR708_05065 [Bacilli bacterium]
MKKYLTAFLVMIIIVQILSLKLLIDISREQTKIIKGYEYEINNCRCYK